MSIKWLTLVLVMTLITGSMSVDASSITSASASAKASWEIGVLEESTEGLIGLFVSVAYYEETNTPYVSYYDPIYNRLKLAYQVKPGEGNCGPEDNWNCIIVDSSGSVGMYSSIDVRTGTTADGIKYPHIGISYYDATNYALKFAEYSCTITCAWTITTIVDDIQNNRLGQTSMKFSSTGVPYIAFHHIIYAIYPTLHPIGTVSIATFVGGGSGNCGSNDWQCDVIDVENNQPLHGHFVSLDISWDDKVNVAFYSTVNHDLYIANYMGSGGDCSNLAWNCTLVDSGGGAVVGYYVSLHAPDNAQDTIKIAYFDFSNYMIKYAVRVGSGGNCSSSMYNCFVVDKADETAAGLVYLGLSISVDEQNLPIIAYKGNASDFGKNLNVARPAAAYGYQAGNCGGIPPGSTSQYWQCETIDPGYFDGYSHGVDEAGYAALVVSPSGLSLIAYFEWDYSGGTPVFRLKLAQQFFNSYLPMIKK